MMEKTIHSRSDSLFHKHSKHSEPSQQIQQGSAKQATPAK